MRKYLVASMIVASLGSFGILGCDKTVSEKKESTSTPSGGGTTNVEKTVQHSDGSTTTEQKTKSTTP